MGFVFGGWAYEDSRMEEDLRKRKDKGRGGDRKAGSRKEEKEGGRQGVNEEGRTGREVKLGSQQSKAKASGYQGVRQRWRK